MIDMKKMRFLSIAFLMGIILSADLNSENLPVPIPIDFPFIGFLPNLILRFFLYINSIPNLFALSVSENILHLVSKALSLSLITALKRIELNYAKYPC